jgi:hypothetical protein
MAVSTRSARLARLDAQRSEMVNGCRSVKTTRWRQVSRPKRL